MARMVLKGRTRRDCYPSWAMILYSDITNYLHSPIKDVVHSFRGSKQSAFCNFNFTEQSLNPWNLSLHIQLLANNEDINLYIHIRKYNLICDKLDTGIKHPTNKCMHTISCCYVGDVYSKHYIKVDNNTCCRNDIQRSSWIMAA